MEKRDTADDVEPSTQVVSMPAGPASAPKHDAAWEEATRTDRPRSRELKIEGAPPLAFEDKTAESDAARNPWEEIPTTPGAPIGRGVADANTDPEVARTPPLSSNFADSTELDLDLWSVGDPPKGAPAPIPPAESRVAEPPALRPEGEGLPPKTLARFGRITVTRSSHAELPQSEGEAPMVAPESMPKPLVLLPPAGVHSSFAPWRTLVAVIACLVLVASAITTWLLLT